MVCLDWGKQNAQLGGFEAATLKAPGGHATGAFQAGVLRVQGLGFRVGTPILGIVLCWGSRKRSRV